jgi:hypothetical protein
MVWAATAVVGSAIIGGYAQSKAASTAAGAQERSAERGIEEHRRQFDAVLNLLDPYVQAGQPALRAQQALLGLRTPEDERAQIAAVERSPTFQSLLRQGEESLLQRASATGGLRGGNVQAALAQFRPQLLAQELENRYTRLGAMTTLGQRSAAGVGDVGLQTGQNISNLYGQMGAAQAGSALAQGQAISNLGQAIPSAVILGRSFQQPSFQFASSPLSSGNIAPSYSGGSSPFA